MALLIPTSQPTCNPNDVCCKCSSDSYDDQCGSLHGLYFIGSVATIIGSLIVIISYIFTPELRYHPSVIIFYRCIVDLGLGICLGFLYLLPNITDAACHNNICSFTGNILLFLFLCSIQYLAKLLNDLRIAITNPFTSPYTGSIIKTNAFIIIISIVLSLIVRWRWDFAYRDDVQYCAIKSINNDKQINIYNLIYFYVPLWSVCAFSVFVTIKAYLRLRKGLPNTFNIRKKAIRDAWSYSLVYATYIAVIGVFYFMSWVQRVYNPDYDYKKKLWYRGFALTFSLIGVTDFVVFFIINFDKYKSGVLCGITNDKKRKRFRSIADDSDTLSKNDDALLQPLSPQRLAILESNEVIINTPNTQLVVVAEEEKKKKRSCLKVACSRMGIAVTSTNKTINEALRREVLAYTTDGIAQAVDGAIGELQLNNYPSNINDSANINKFYVTIKKNWAVTLRKRPLYNRYKSLISTEEMIKINRCCCWFITIGGRSRITTREHLITVNSQPVEQLNTYAPPLNVSINSSSPPPVTGPGASSKKTRTGDGDDRSGVFISSKTKSDHKADVKYKKQREFTDYAPLVFKYIRQHIIGLTDQEYKKSIIPESKKEQIKVLKKCKCGEGKSKAFFYITHDSKYVVKTIPKHEVKKFLSILKDYKTYLEANRQTILSRCVGLHSIKIYGLTKYFMVLENVFVGQYKPHEVYDLKGSWVGRYTDHSISSNGTRKDLDLKRYVILNKHNRNKIISQLNKDTYFLSRNNIMDYSLLLGIYYMTIECQEPTNIDINKDIADKEEQKYDIDNNRNNKKIYSLNNITSIQLHNDYQNCNDYYLGGVRSHIIEGPGIYFFGIIDGLQGYTFRKRFETWFRKNIQRLDGKGISCISPKSYKNRFMRHMKNIIISDVRYKEKKFGKKYNKKKASKEQVYVYPSSENIKYNLNQIKKEKFEKLSQSENKKSLQYSYNNPVSLPNIIDIDKPLYIVKETRSVARSKSLSNAMTDYE